MVTIEKLLKDGLKIINKREYNNPFLDIQLILCYLLKKDKIFLHAHKNELVSEDISRRFYEMAARRNEGYPLQYMINDQEFMGLNLFIQDGVLVPRPDTECLVEKIIKIVKENYNENEKIKILDVGTGSGAIAVSLAYYLKNSNVTAIDISSIALETSLANKRRYNLDNLNIIKADIFQDIDIKDKFDIVVSNPPYIETDAIGDLPVEVSVYEPKTALDGGADGLVFYKEIARIFKKIHSLKKAVLSVEIGYDQREAVEKILDDINVFDKIETDKDYGGNDRVVTGFL